MSEETGPVEQPIIVHAPSADHALRGPEAGAHERAKALKASLTQQTGSGLIQAGVETQIPVDPFTSFYWTRNHDEDRSSLTFPVQPLQSLDALIYIYGVSSLLPSIGAAIERNVELKGWKIEERIIIDEDTPPAVVDMVRLERRSLKHFFVYIGGSQYALEEMLKRARHDFEATGWRALEVLRKPPPHLAEQQAAEGEVKAKESQTALTNVLGAPPTPGLKATPDWSEVDYRGEPVGARHVEAHTLRWCGISAPILFPVWRLVEGDESDPDDLKVDGYPVARYEEFFEYRRFRLIQQSQYGFSALSSSGVDPNSDSTTNATGGLGRLFFQEFGDPRIVDRFTGEVIGNYVTGEWPDLEEYPPSRWANELLVDIEYEPNFSPYGAPWWWGQYENAMGLDAADVANKTGIKSPKIPRVIIGAIGTAARKDLERLQEEIDENRVDNPGKNSEMVFLEITPPEGDGDVVEGTGASKTGGLVVHQLNVSHDDLYGAYIDRTRKTMRGRRGVSNKALGESEDDSFASAEASVIMDDEQVWEPERQRNARWLAPLLQALRIRFNSWEPAASKIMSSEQRREWMKTADEVGAMTPNRAIPLINAELGTNYSQITEEWGDQPFELTKAESQSAAAFGVPSEVDLEPEGEEAPGENETESAAQKSAPSSADMLPPLRAMKAILVDIVRRERAGE